MPVMKNYSCLEMKKTKKKKLYVYNLFYSSLYLLYRTGLQVYGTACLVGPTNLELCSSLTNIEIKKKK